MPPAIGQGTTVTSPRRSRLTLILGLVLLVLASAAAALLLLSGRGSGGQTAERLGRLRDEFRSLESPSGATPRGRSSMTPGCTTDDSGEKIPPAAIRRWWVERPPAPAVEAVVRQLTAAGWSLEAPASETAPARLSRDYDGWRATAVVRTRRGPAEVTPDIPVDEVSILGTADGVGC